MLTLGCSTVDITPKFPVWMSGYGSRDRKSDGVYQALEAGALALRESRLTALILTADVLGYDLAFAAAAKARIAEATGVLPEHIVLTATHTHCGPHFCPMAMPGEPETGWAELFMQKLVEVAVSALSNPRPARIEFSRGRSNFGINRRLPDGKGGVLFKPSPNGPIDRDLDALWFVSQRGKVLASLTIYGCHPTCGGGYKLGGDYPGFFRRKLRKISGAPAFFATGCSGNIRPNFLKDGGFRAAELDEIEAVGAQMASDAWASRDQAQRIRAHGMSLRTAFHCLPYAEVPDEKLFAEAKDSKDKLIRAWAKHFNKLRKRGPLPDSCPQEVQLLSLNHEFSVVFLGGEILTEIGLRLKRAFAPGTLMTAAYSNGLIGYVPSKKTYDLGGYEVSGSYRYFLRPARFAKSVEDRIVATVRALAGQSQCPR